MPQTAAKPRKKTRRKHVRFVSAADRIFYRADRDDKLRQQGMRCIYCGEKLSFREATTDHVTPLSRTSHRLHSGANAVVACVPCNSRKGDRGDFQARKAAADGGYVCQALEDRIQLALWRLSFDTKGSFAKWRRFHEKQGTLP